MKPLVRYTNNPSYRPYTSPKGVKIALGRALNSAITEALSKTGATISGEEINNIKSELYTSIDKKITNFNKEFVVDGLKISIEFKSFGLDRWGEDYKHYDIYVYIYRRRKNCNRIPEDKEIANIEMGDVNINNNKYPIFSTQRTILKKEKQDDEDKKQQQKKEKGDNMNHKKEENYLVTEKKHKSPEKENSHIDSNEGLYNKDKEEGKVDNNEIMEVFELSTKIKDLETLERELNIVVQKLEEDEDWAEYCDIYSNIIDTLRHVTEVMFDDIADEWLLGEACVELPLFRNKEWNFVLKIEPEVHPQFETNNNNYKIKIVLVKKGA